MIVAGNDLIAISAIRCLSELGVNVPEECIDHGFRQHPLDGRRDAAPDDNCAAARRHCKKAVELMHGSMSGEKIRARHTIFDVSLVERDSVRRIGRTRS